MRKVLFLIIITFCLMISAKAECSYSEIANLKSLVNNINISYDYHIKDNMAYFDVTINNITPDMYFIDNYSRKTYTYSNTNNGEITIKDYYGDGGLYLFYSAKSECYGKKLGSKYYNFPSYNRYYNDPLCADIKNLSVCQKWAKVNYNYSDFQKKVKEYKEEKEKPEKEVEEYEKNMLDKIIEFYVKYYVYILVSIIVVFGGIVLIERKTNRFKI